MWYAAQVFDYVIHGTLEASDSFTQQYPTSLPEDHPPRLSALGSSTESNYPLPFLLALISLWHSLAEFHRNSSSSGYRPQGKQASISSGVARTTVHNEININWSWGCCYVIKPVLLHCIRHCTGDTTCTVTLMLRTESNSLMALPPHGR